MPEYIAGNTFMIFAYARHSVNLAADIFVFDVAMQLAGEILLFGDSVGFYNRHSVFRMLFFSLKANH